MIQLLPLYLWAIVAGVLCAMALALHGCHLVSRDQSLQSLVVSQAATVSVLLGAALTIDRPSQISDNPVPLLCGFVVAAVSYFAGEHLVAARSASKTSIFLSFLL